MRLQTKLKCAFIPVLWLLSAITGAAGGDAGIADPRALYSDRIDFALGKVNLSMQALSQPKLAIPYSTPARQQAVDSAMHEPLWMLDTGRKLLAESGAGESPASYVTGLLSTMGYRIARTAAAGQPRELSAKYISELENINIDPGEKRVVKALITRLAYLAEQYRQHHIVRETSLSQPVLTHLRQLIRDEGTDPDNRWLTLADYHRIGQAYIVEEQARYLLDCLDAIAEYADVTKLKMGTSVEWETPLGKIGLAGDSDDTHSGHYFILIDTGGNDSYRDVGVASTEGGFTFVIDLNGNDDVSWRNSSGPGAGIFGIGVWADMSGDDTYHGRNAGIGVGLFGAGALWDKSGDDHYQSGSLTQGTGVYGVGILIDAMGNDQFNAELSSQGFAGTGGLGMLIDHAGNDRYSCGGMIPDRAEDRVARHTDLHYISMCQGYSFGERPTVSGGVGLLMDRDGNDVYDADIFAQGGSYWFGLGMLLDGKGNDRYTAFEHAQGASLHLGAAFLGDFGGNDSYQSNEHSQGVGIDRSIGILLDEQGDDSYHAVTESQGAGIKPFGAGMLIDASGNDEYVSQRDSQGYSATLPVGFPDSQWPVGLLLDLSGTNQLKPFTGTPVRNGVRIQNRQGVAVEFSAAAMP